jgi:hypothetical protein
MMNKAKELLPATDGGCTNVAALLKGEPRPYLIRQDDMTAAEALE